MQMDNLLFLPIYVICIGVYRVVVQSRLSAPWLSLSREWLIRRLIQGEMVNDRRNNYQFLFYFIVFFSPSQCLGIRLFLFLLWPCRDAPECSESNTQTISSGIVTRLNCPRHQLFPTEHYYYQYQRVVDTSCLPPLLYYTGYTRIPRNGSLTVLRTPPSQTSRTLLPKWFM